MGRGSSGAARSARRTAVGATAAVLLAVVALGVGIAQLPGAAPVPGPADVPPTEAVAEVHCLSGQKSMDWAQAPPSGGELVGEPVTSARFCDGRAGAVRLPEGVFKAGGDLDERLWALADPEISQRAARCSAPAGPTYRVALRLESGTTAHLLGELGPCDRLTWLDMDDSGAGQGGTVHEGAAVVYTELMRSAARDPGPLPEPPECPRPQEIAELDTGSDAASGFPLGPEPLASAVLCRFDNSGSVRVELPARDDYDLLESLRVQLPEGGTGELDCPTDPDAPIDVVVLQDATGGIYAFSVDHGFCGELTASFDTDVTYASVGLTRLLDEWWSATAG
ncbi:MAG TPA: hypothetical protein VGP51_06310 [Nocardioidaceae bacterium]|nr:hypothetical protein [Nocardioidaceae bacterium]